MRRRRRASHPTTCCSACSSSTPTMPNCTRSGRRRWRRAAWQVRARQNPAELGRLAASFLARPDGPRIAMLETGGWDTHSAQAPRMANQLKALDAMVAALRDGLGAAWAETTVLVATEFGRTVAANGTGGTDHGTASAAMLLGGAVQGGRVLADWPGLALVGAVPGARPAADDRDGCAHRLGHRRMLRHRSGARDAHAVSAGRGGEVDVRLAARLSRQRTIRGRQLGRVSRQTKSPGIVRCASSRTGPRADGDRREAMCVGEAAQRDLGVRVAKARLAAGSRRRPARALRP